MYDCLRSVCPCFFTRSGENGPNVDSDQNLSLGQRVYNVFYNIMSFIFRWSVAQPNGNGPIEPVNGNLGAGNRAVSHITPNSKGKEEVEEAFQSIHWSPSFRGLWNGRKLEGDEIVYDGNEPLVISEDVLREIRGTNCFLNSLFQVFSAMGTDFCQKLCQKHSFFRPYFEQYADESRRGVLTLNGLRAGAERLGLKLEQDVCDPADFLNCLGEIKGEITRVYPCRILSGQKNISILNLLGKDSNLSDSKFQVFQINYSDVDGELVYPEMNQLKCHSPLSVGEDLWLSGCSYMLKAFVRYVQGAEGKGIGSHYRAYVSRLNPETQDTEYFCCDDEEITLISEETFNTHVNFAHLIFFEKQK